MLLGTLNSILLGNILEGKARIPWRGVIRAGEETIGADQDF